MKKPPFALKTGLGLYRLGLDLNRARAATMFQFALSSRPVRQLCKPLIQWASAKVLQDKTANQRSPDNQFPVRSFILYGAPQESWPSARQNIPCNRFG